MHLFIALIFAISSPKKAMLFSMIYPGLGQFYNRQYVKATFFSATATYFLISSVVNYRTREEYKPYSSEWYFYEKRAFSFFIAYMFIYLYSIADAYVSRHFLQVGKKFERRRFYETFR